MRIGTCEVTEISREEFADSLLDELQRFCDSGNLNKISQRSLIDLGWRWLFSLRMSYNGQSEKIFYDIVSRRFERSGDFWILKLD